MTHDSESPDPVGSSRPSDELLDLILNFSEGAIDAAGVARLNEMLQGAATNRAAYTQFMQLIARLEWDRLEAFSGATRHSTDLGLLESLTSKRRIFSPPSADNPLDISLAPKASIARICGSGWKPSLLFRPIPAAIYGSLATLIVVILIQQVRHVQSEKPDSAPVVAVLPEQLAAAPIAYLASSIGSSWGEDSSGLQGIGSPVNLGDELTLQEGIAEFRLSNGVYLSIEGPAGLVLNSPSSVVLQYGKVTSHVPSSVADFKVLAGASRLTACGAEFGVYLSGDDVDIHVFSGEVLAVNVTFMEGRQGFEVSNEKEQEELDVDRTDRTGMLTEVVVQHGRSIALRGDGDAVEVANWSVADDTKFATRLPMAAPLPITKDYVDAVLASRPIGYWRFESTTGDVVKNGVRKGDNLEVFGKVRLIGESRNRVVELGGAESDGFLAAPDSTDALAGSDYGVELWLRPSHVHAGSIVTLAGISPETHDERPGLYLGLHGSGNGPYSGAFSGVNPGSVRFLNRNPPSGDRATGVSCYSDLPYQLRRWQHVAAVKEGPEMRLYLNAKLAATGVDGKSLAAALRLIVGESSTTQRTFRFRGQLDELALYDRALTHEEIDRHFKTVRWSTDGTSDATEQTSLRTLF